MKVIIAGSRTINDYETVKNAILHSGFDIDIVVCGCALGVDYLGEKFAKEKGLPVNRFPANWDKFGKAAGPIRNQQMAENADALILVWDGKSRGSTNMLKCAKSRNLKVYERVI